MAAAPLKALLGWLVVVLVGVIAALVWVRPGSASVIEVPRDHPTISQALSAAADGATIRLDQGVYEESLLIDKPVTLESKRDGAAEVRGFAGAPTISVLNTSDVTIRLLTISGGEVGVLVRNSKDVTITENTISDNHMRGVRVVFGSARISENLIADTSGRGAKGIHIANATSWPESTISGNVVERSGAEGILTNLAHVTIEDNVVRDNDGGGIAISEMSVASVLGNTVTGNAETGILVLDMSTASVDDNDIEVAVGDGIRLEFHSEAQLYGNHILSESGCGIVVGGASFIAGGRNRLLGATQVCGQFPDLVR